MTDLHLEEGERMNEGRRERRERRRARRCWGVERGERAAGEEKMRERRRERDNTKRERERRRRKVSGI